MLLSNVDIEHKIEDAKRLATGSLVVEKQETNIRNTFFIGDIAGLKRQSVTDVDPLTMQRFIAEREVNKRQQPHSKHVYKSTEFIKTEGSSDSRKSLQDSWKFALQPHCDLRLVETLPAPLVGKGLRSIDMPTVDAFLTLIKGSKSHLSIMSQWAIDGSGSDKLVFDEMVKAANERNVSMEIVFNSHSNFDENGAYSPNALKSNRPDLIQCKSPSIEGKITPGHKGNIIHSKLVVADE